MKAASWRDLAPFVVEVRRQLDLASLSIKVDHFTDAVAKAVPMPLGQEINLVNSEVHGSGGDFVQQGLPQMSARLVDQRDFSEVAPTEFIPQPGYELERAGAATDHNDVMKIGALAAHVRPRILLGSNPHRFTRAGVRRIDHSQSGHVKDAADGRRLRKDMCGFFRAEQNGPYGNATTGGHPQ
jgi:hypothetical protein